jgi:hypothetical protein
MCRFVVAGFPVTLPISSQRQPTPLTNALRREIFVAPNNKHRGQKGDFIQRLDCSFVVRGDVRRCY